MCVCVGVCVCVRVCVGVCVCVCVWVGEGEHEHCYLICSQVLQYICVMFQSMVLVQHLQYPNEKGYAGGPKW